MKRLSNLKLNESFELLSKQEMKVVVGGYSGGGHCNAQGATCSESCVTNGGFSGTCDWAIIKKDDTIYY